jgi:hypothetical protein
MTRPLQVLLGRRSVTFSGDLICAMTRFVSGVVPRFGLPQSIPSHQGHGSSASALAISLMPRARVRIFHSNWTYSL